MWERGSLGSSIPQNGEKYREILWSYAKNPGEGEREKENFSVGGRECATFAGGGAGVEKGEEREMEGNRRTEAVRALRRLARGRANDAVKLAYLTEERLEEIDRMDLSALTEFKRHGNGAVEVKFVDRAAILERLLELEDGETGGAAGLLRALEGEET